MRKVKQPEPPALLGAPLDALVEQLADVLAKKLIERLPLPAAAPTNGASEWLTMDEAAAHLGLTRSTLETWRGAGTGPPAHRVGKRALRYSRAELDAYVAKGTKP